MNFHSFSFIFIWFCRLLFLLMQSGTCSTWITCKEKKKKLYTRRAIFLNRQQKFFFSFWCRDFIRKYRQHDWMWGKTRRKKAIYCAHNHKVNFNWFLLFFSRSKLEHGFFYFFFSVELCVVPLPLLCVYGFHLNVIFT